MSLSEEKQPLQEESITISIITRGNMKMKLILCFAVMMGLALKLLRYERNKDGYLVPVDIFRGYSNLFYAFVICVMFAFTGSAGALAIPPDPKLDRFRRVYSVCAFLSMAFALGILSFACLLDFMY